MECLNTQAVRPQQFFVVQREKERLFYADVALNFFGFFRKFVYFSFECK